MESDNNELINDENIKESNKQWHKNTYLVISTVAYLAGVPYGIFEKESQSPKIEYYDRLKYDKNARIIRNLCILRTSLERNYKNISDRMRYDIKNLNSLPEYISQDSLNELMDDGISIIKANYRINNYIIDINKLICDRINNCKSLFPIWINWDYIKELFIMPNGLKEDGIKAAATKYYSDLNGYPYQVYMNLRYLPEGNILYNDYKFVTFLYETHEDKFDDLSKVFDAGEQTKDEIYQYLRMSNKTAIVVDCENSDPYKLYATLNNLDQNELLGKIVKIILLDDVHTTTAWDVLCDFTEIEIEHILVERLKDDKSYLDVRLTAKTCKEFYQNNVDSFILVSSDSDYWGLISEIQEAKFFVMIESRKCGPAIKKALEDYGISYCYIDNFSTGNSNDIKEHAIVKEMHKIFDEYCYLNVNEIFENALVNTRAELSPAEKTQFYNKYIKPIHLVVEKDGIVYLELGKRD